MSEIVWREESDAEVLRRGERGAAAWRRRLRRGDDEGRPTNLDAQATLAGRAAADRGEPEDLVPSYVLPSLEAAWKNGHQARITERRTEAKAARDAQVELEAKARAEAEAARVERERVEAEQKAAPEKPKRNRRPRRW